MQKTDKVSFSKMRSMFFFGMIFLLSIAMLYLFQPFFYPIFWAAVIAVMFYPHYEWLNNYLKMPSLNAGIMVGVVILTIFVPLTLIITLIVNKAGDLYGKLNLTSTDVTNWITHSPLQPYTANIIANWTNYASEFGQKVSGFVIDNVKSITQNSVGFLFKLFLMFYTLFFFFRDGERILKRLMHLSPLGDQYERMLYDRFTSTARATLKSTLIVATEQGTLGGIIFWITGVPGALIWTILMTAICIIPAVGSFIVWLPISLIMLAMGNIWQGLTILLFGMFVISTIDNLLRPPLIGKDTQMHPLLVLFSTLGGILLFGISGFVIGPVLASLYLAIMSIYNHYYENELQEG